VATTAGDAPVSGAGKPGAPAGARTIPEPESIEAELRQKNQDLNAAYEEISCTRDALRRSNNDLSASNTALRRSERELRQAHHDVTQEKKLVTRERDQMNNLLEIAGVMILALDTEGKVTLINRRGSEILGFPAEEIVGKDWIEHFLPPRIGKKMRNMFRRVVTGEIADFRSNENPVLTHDGNEREILWSNTLITDGAGNVTGILSSGEDITDRKTTEDALQESESRYRNLVESSPDGIVVHRRGKFLYANAAALILYGAQNLGELAEKNMLDLIHPDDRPAIAERIKQTTSGGNIPLRETTLLTLEGRPVNVETVGGPVTYRGEPATQVIIRDISLRKIAENAVRESEDRFRSVLDNSMDVIYRLNMQTRRFEYISPSSEKVTGFPPGELMALDGGQALAMIHPEDLPGMKAALAQLEKTGRAEAEYRQRTRDGSWRWISNHLSLIRDETGQPLYHDGTIRDITDTRAAEDERRRQHADLNAAYAELAATRDQLQQNIDELETREHQLNETLAEKEILLSEIHHRVKNNLTAFISLLSLDGASEDTEAGRNLKKDLQNRARSMALIHDTLYRTRNFSRVDMEVYLTTLVGQIAASYASRGDVGVVVEAKGVVLDLSRATTAGLIVNELITNSYKYAFPPSFDCQAVRGAPCTIQVAMTEQDGSYMLSVSDNGRGLPDGIDPLSSKTLGLRLVNFLARHQLRAEMSLNGEKGTGFVFVMDLNPAHS
jgi:PAS domain S-box-containing protein